MSIMKIFCGHKWKTHLSKEVSIETRLSKEEQAKYGVEMATKNFTREVLICEKCGKITIIEY